MNFFLKVDEKNKKSFCFELFFCFEFNDDLKCQITFSIFLLNFLIEIYKENLFIIQFEN